MDNWGFGFVKKIVGKNGGFIFGAFGGGIVANAVANSKYVAGGSLEEFVD